MLNLEILRIIWWLLMGILFMGFAVTDGFDLGAAMLLPLVARNEIERRIVLNSIGPFWEGNQTWIILGAGAIFAAWPFVYAVAFSGTYFVILLLLLTMGISRPVSFKYRSKLPNHFWRRFWDWIVFLGGLLPAIILGMLVGNILTGIPFYFDNDLRIHYSGSCLGLFHPFALWCGLTSVFMLTMHGGLFLAIKTKDAVRSRALFWSRLAAILLIICFILAGIWVATGLTGYKLVTNVDPFGVSNPLHKAVVTETGAWINNYSLYPITILLPILGILGAFIVILTASFGNSRFAFLCSSVSLIGIIGTVGVSMFPFILPSSAHLTSSLLVWDASSSELTLLVMLFAVIVFMPIILLYTFWVYHALRGKVEEETIKENKQAY